MIELEERKSTSEMVREHLGKYIKGSDCPHDYSDKSCNEAKDMPSRTCKRCCIVGIIHNDCPDDCTSLPCHKVLTTLQHMGVME